MRIIDEEKLDFKNVLIVPKRSKLESRSNVDLRRTFNFKNSGKTWTGVPIMVSNMDTTGTFEMATKLYDHKMITCIHKHKSLNQWAEFLRNHDNTILNHIAISIGISDLILRNLQI